MSRAAGVRLIIGFGGGLAALAAWIVIENPIVGVLAALFLFMSSSAAAGTVFRRMATGREIQADLEDRVRNPPS